MGVLSFMLGRASVRQSNVSDGGQEIIDCGRCVKRNECIDAFTVNVCSTYEEE